MAELREAGEVLIAPLFKCPELVQRSDSPTLCDLESAQGQSLLGLDSRLSHIWYNKAKLASGHIVDTGELHGAVPNPTEMIGNA